MLQTIRHFPSEQYSELSMIYLWLDSQHAIAELPFGLFWSSLSDIKWLDLLAFFECWRQSSYLKKKLKEHLVFIFIIWNCLWLIFWDLATLHHCCSDCIVVVDLCSNLLVFYAAYCDYFGVTYIFDNNKRNSNEILWNPIA